MTDSLCFYDSETYTVVNIDVSIQIAIDHRNVYWKHEEDGMLVLSMLISMNCHKLGPWL